METEIKNKYLFYLDDSGTGENPCYLGGFIIQNGKNETDLQIKFRKIKKDLLANENAYIKWSPTKKDNPEQYKLLKKEKESLKEQLLKLVIQYEIVIILAIIRKDTDYWSSQSEALRRLAERFVYFISGKEGFNCTKKGYYPYGQIILDYLGPRDKKNNLTKTYHDYWVEGNVYSTDLYDYIIEKEKWRKVELNHCLRETIFFSQGKYCDLLQIADFITGTVRELIKNKNNKFYNLIKDKIRKDEYGNVNGYGLIFIPKEIESNYKPII